MTSSTSHIHILVTSVERALSTLALDNVTQSSDAEEASRKALTKLKRAVSLAKAQGNAQVDETKADDLEHQFRTLLLDRESRKQASFASKRVQLLTSNVSQHRKDVLGNADLLAQSRDANESLLRTRDLIVGELARLGEVGKVLTDDSERIRDVGEEYNAYDGALNTAKGILKNMQRRENTDRMLLGFGLGFFVLVVLYILKRRLMPFFSPLAWLLEMVVNVLELAAVHFNDAISSSEIKQPAGIGEAVATATSATPASRTDL